MKRLFGTDGIRGVAGTPPLDPPTVRRFGAALAEVLAEVGGGAPRVVFGRDTRESGPWLRDSAADGLRARGGTAVDAGVVTTPGLAHAVGADGFDAGVMISASHNPFEDNGLKVFGADGRKLSDDLEKEIEARILDRGIVDPGSGNGKVPLETDLARRYVSFLESVLAPGRLSGLRLVLDCANGSASAIAPEVYRHYGAEISVTGAYPDGRNINLDCGSLHLEALAAAVVRTRSDVGIAFDGDADRALAVDRKGRTIDGDHILFLVARSLGRAGALRGNRVVATVMSNLWLERHLAADGVSLARAPVGDKYVLERMIADGAVLGGEQSGHVIFLDRAQAGDGILTGLLFLDAVLGEERPLEEILDGIVPCPQVLLNVRVREKPDLTSHSAVGPVLREVEEALGGTGRVVLRYSGTEPLARVMIEGDDDAKIRTAAERLAGAIRDSIG